MPPLGLATESTPFTGNCSPEFTWHAVQLPRMPG